MDTKLKAQLSRSNQARGRAVRVDASIMEIRIGTERMVEMLSHVPISKTVTHAPPALSCTRKGGGAADDADGEEEDEGPLGQEPNGPATIGPVGSVEPPRTAPDAQTVVSLALHPRCVPPKGSAAEAAVSALADLKQLARLEDTMAFGASRSLESAVAALHNLAAIEHRIVTTVLPEIQRSDARTRMKQGHFTQRRVERLHKLSDAAAAVTVTNLIANLADHLAQDHQKFDDSFVLEGSPATQTSSPQTSSFFFITQATEAATAAETAAAEAAVAEAAAAEAAAAEKAVAEAAAAEAAEAEAAPPPATLAMRPSSAGPSGAGASMVPPRRPSSAMSKLGSVPMSKLGSVRSGGAKTKVRPVGELAIDPKLLDKLHEKLAHEYNVRIFVEGYAEGGPSSDKTAEKAKERNRQYLRCVFSTFDDNNSGIITLLKVRALFDRLALGRACIRSPRRLLLPTGTRAL